MIQLLRVDDKLLHGQIAFSWVRNLHIHTIIIADDKVAHDEFSKMTLGLSKPSGVNLQILDMNQAITQLKQHETSKINVMAIVNNITNAKRILDEISTLKSLNLGVLRMHYQSQKVDENIALDAQEREICASLMEEGYEIELRLRYDDRKIMLEKVLETME